MWDFADVYKKDQFAVSYITFHEWMYKKNKGGKIADFFKMCHYETFAICGMSSLGILFLEEALKEQLRPLFIIDKNSDLLCNKYEIKVIQPQQIPTTVNVDVYVICHVYYYNRIADELVSLGVPESKIISLNDIIFSI